MIFFQFFCLICRGDPPAGEGGACLPGQTPQGPRVTPGQSFRLVPAVVSVRDASTGDATAVQRALAVLRVHAPAFFQQLAHLPTQG